MELQRWSFFAKIVIIDQADLPLNKLFRKQYPKACKDLEEAYRLDKNHKNAKRYLIQILFEHAGILSKAAKNKDDLEQSVTCLKRILELDSDHHEARSKLRILT